MATVSEFREYFVRSWNAMYYVTSLQKWTIKITQINGEWHWFSSFENRNEVFLLINHFFQKRACQNVLSSSSSLSSSTLLPYDHQRTKMGTELLQSVYDSQATLQKGAVSLVEQGHQLRNAAVKMEEIHEDLTVAERITKGINSWLGRWKLPPTVKADELILVRDNDIPDVWDIEALCSKIIGCRHENQNINVFRISGDGLSIIDMKQKLLHHFKLSDISCIKVVSPWEIFVTQSFIGQPDLSFNVISSSLPSLLPKLEQYFKRKIEYMNPPDSHQTRHFEPHWDKPVVKSLKSKSTPKSLSDNVNDREQLVVSTEKQKSIISDAEISELTSTLANLKSLALDIQVEQTEQLTVIDSLTQSVTKANDRIQSVNKVINKNNK
ncbi:synaptosomal-associated protein 47-like isoform X2 [Biomphalaria glabrata]|uniref:Synaptosomal-associated protein 47-like isoform X2 n=1 Tax=Biomphalaria glabrata TaxID=6526 RepID=A0A9W2Z1F4_BIOGL|nr:synaptosomal-associated protein 47-like isoform X2 [Biomphalaria glabrata]